MKKSKVLKRVMAVLMAFTLTVSMGMISDVQSINAYAEETTSIYFLNDQGWDIVNAYTYNPELLSGWPGQTAVAAPEIGDNWVKVSVSQAPPFNIIFFDKNADSNRAELYLGASDQVFVTSKGLSYSTKDAAEQAVYGMSTTVYFYDNKEWGKVSCYVYGNPGEALGGWPGTEALDATELGTNWKKVNVAAETPFSIIFFNASNDSERTELYLGSDRNVYLTGNNAAFSSKTEAELSCGASDESLMTTLHFYNSRGFGDINGYFYEKDENDNAYVVGTGWPGTKASKDETLGENWWTISVPKDASSTPFYAIFNDGVEQTSDVLITDKEMTYMTAAGELFNTKEEAENAAKNDTYDDGCEKGENTDYASYEVDLTGVGANLPYVTHEAEKAVTNGTILTDARIYRQDIQSEASGRRAVKLTETGNFVEFTLTEEANAFVLRYCMPDSNDGTGINASLSLYIDGERKNALDLTSEYAWVYGGYPYNNNVSQGNAHRFFDESRFMLDKTYPAGTKIRLMKEATDTASYYIIDLLETEKVAEKITRPENSLSVTEYGAVANDGNDDYAAFAACIEAAKAQGKSVWIPEGTYNLTEKRAIEADSVVIHGAGMWYTNLTGAGAAFKFSGTSKFYDFALTGVSTKRDDSGDLAGFEGNGKKATNVTIQNIWMEHMKVGVWSANCDRMLIQGCRIRNTYADGINLCSGTNNSTVRSNNLRNTGDDCIAIWPWLGDCTGNEISNNTVSVPTLANGIAIYGGGNNTVSRNLVSDIINNGAGIAVGSEFETKAGFSGPITVTGNVLLRAGSMQTDENYAVGAIWMWSSYHGAMNTSYIISDNKIYDSSYEGILIECNAGITGLEINNNLVSKATDAITVFYGNESYGLGYGEGTYKNLKTENLSGNIVNSGNPNFKLTEVVSSEENSDEKQEEINPTEPEETVVPEETNPTGPEETVVPEEINPTEPEETVVPEETKPAEPEETVTPEVTNPTEKEEAVIPVKDLKPLKKSIKKVIKTVIKILKKLFI